ncbi:MAG: hypothetical protein NT062_21035 [Proteobacteria bacterium]|nr:hypothetical protein [Pseudomonadota bacterium]
MRSTCAALILIAAAACGDVPTEEHPPIVPLTFGELVFRVIRTNLVAAPTCSIEYVGQLEPHHAAFATSVDFALAEDIRNDVPELLGNTIQPVVANGTLPGLVDRVGESLHLLVDDQVDPARKTLTSIVSLSTAPTLLESAMVTDLAAGVLASPTLPAVLHSTRLLAQEHDGVALVLDDVLDLATHGAAAPTNSCTGLTLDDVQGTLLRTDGFVDDPHYALGDPAWMVRPDARGNPRVLVDAATGKLAEPFVDLDADGVADVGPSGRPVDAYGRLIELSYLRPTGPRDAAGRALNAHGGLLYDYYDVKRTALSYTMQLGADFLAAKVHHQIPAIADAVLGAPVPCSDGTTTCRAYATTNHPLADLAHLGLELLRFPKTSSLMAVLHQLMITDAAKAEDLLVAAGDVITALQGSTLSLSDTAMYDALIGVVPLVRQIFGTANTTGLSTPHLLVDLLASMSPAEKAQIEQSVGWMVEYASLASRPNPTPDGPAVDYRHNRFYQSAGNWVDNRSGLEQAVELLGYADCGFIGCSQGSFSTSCVAATALDGLFGDPDDGTVSEWLLGAMSSKSPATVSSLITVIDWLNNFSIPFVCNGAGCALEALGCSSARADDAAAHIPALRSLANSGGLDWLLPIARVFAAQHQMAALVDIFDYVASDLWKSGEYDRKVDNANSFVRRLEPPILSASNTHAVVKLLAMLDVLHGITVPGVPGSTDHATHLLVDMVDYAIQQRTVNARRAPVANSSIASELLKSARTVSSRIDAANAEAALTSVVQFETQYLTETTTLPGGTRVLAHPNVRMQLAVGLDAVADLSALAPAQQACYVDHFQATTEAFLTGRTFATLVRLAKHVIGSPNAAPVEDWLVTLLRGTATGPLLQLTAAASSADVAGDDLTNVASWLQGVTQNQSSAAMTTLVALDDLVQSDANGTMVQILRNLVSPGPADGAAPVSVFAATLGDVTTVDTGNACMLREVVTVPILEHVVTSLSAFLLDDVYGITSIWKLVGTLGPH